MCRDHMLEWIRERLESASNEDVEAVYWMVLIELGEG